jgi:Domain of unknown function (DUF4314)
MNQEKLERLQLLVGKRIELIKMVDDPNPIPSGEQGVVVSVNSLGIIDVNWDCERTLNLIHGVDKYKLV